MRNGQPQYSVLMYLKCWICIACQVCSVWIVERKDFVAFARRKQTLILQLVTILCSEVVGGNLSVPSRLTWAWKNRILNSLSPKHDDQVFNVTSSHMNECWEERKFICPVYLISKFCRVFCTGIVGFYVLYWPLEINSTLHLQSRASRRTCRSSSLSCYRGHRSKSQQSVFLAWCTVIEITIQSFSR